MDGAEDALLDPEGAREAPLPLPQLVLVDQRPAQHRQVRGRLRVIRAVVGLEDLQRLAVQALRLVVVTILELDRPEVDQLIAHRGVVRAEELPVHVQEDPVERVGGGEVARVEQRVGQHRHGVGQLPARPSARAPAPPCGAPRRLRRTAPRSCRMVPSAVSASTTDGAPADTRHGGRRVPGARGLRLSTCAWSSRSNPSATRLLAAAAPLAPVRRWLSASAAWSRESARSRLPSCW